MTHAKRIAGFIRAKRGWLLLAVLIGLLYFAWTEITKTRGVQEVQFRAASSECSASGALKYCVHEAQGGTNGDVVYHLHGRNLDEQIWNDDTYFTALVQSDWQRVGAAF